MANTWARLGRALLVPLLRSVTRQSGRRQPAPPARGPRRGAGAPAGGAAASGASTGHDGGRWAGATGAARGAAYAGDYRGALSPIYSPKPDGRPDPGEIVWAWVPYEEDHAQGKDRPVLVVGRDGRHLLALMLTSKDHTRQGDRDYVDVGAGAWDRQGRPSEVKLDRVVRLDEAAVRREGAVLDRARFEVVAAALAQRR